MADERRRVQNLDERPPAAGALDGKSPARPEPAGEPELILHWRPDFTRTFVNEAYCRYFGASAAELLGQSVLDVVAPEHWAQMREKVKRLGPDHPVEVDEYRVVKRDGSSGWQTWVDRAVLDGRRVVELRSVGREITERVALDRQHRRARTMEAIGLLAGGIAHDLDNLLLAILTRIERAQSVSGAGPHLEEIAVAAHRAARLNRQLLTLSRSRALDLETVDLREVLARLLPVLRALVRAEGVQVHLELSPRPCRARADVGRIDQVVIQLAVNAFDAMPTGGRLLIDVAPVSVGDPEDLDPGYVQPPPRGPYVRVRVTDSGPGIDVRDLPSVFEPAHRAGGRDLGLGLSSVWGIVRQHRGHVAARNVRPEGTCFELLLPRLDSAEQSDRTPRGSGTEPRVHVLLIEGDGAVRRVMRTALETRGFVVREARDARQARDAVEQGLVPELVVMDVALPGPGGPGLYRELARRFPGLRCLFFLSGDQEEPATSPLGAGIAYLGRPFSLNELHQAIAQTQDTMSASLGDS